jgi:hypothetical protein
MTIQVVALSVEEMQGFVADAYKEGYIKAQREWEKEKSAKKDEPKFSETIRGCKELRQYFIYKDYWSGSISTLSKVAPQLLLEDDKQGHGLIFRRTCIDHYFSQGFRFRQPPKNKKPGKMSKKPFLHPKIPLMAKIKILERG